MRFYICSECGKIITIDNNNLDIKCCDKKCSEISLSNEDGHKIDVFILIQGCHRN